MSIPSENRLSAFRLLQTAVLSRIIRAVRSIVLARLLLPEVFGGYALIGAVIGPLTSLTNIGLTGLIAREAAPSDSLVGAARWASRAVVLGAGAVLLIGVSVWVHVAGHEDLLGPGIVVALATAVYFAPQVHLGLLQQRKDFRSIARTELAFDVFWGMVAVGLAVATRSIWSLALAEIGAQLLRAVMAKKQAGPLPPRRRNSSTLRHLFRFSAASVTSSVLWSLVFALPAPFLQRHCSTQAIGLFALAYTYSQFAALMLSSVTLRVLLPTLGRTPVEYRVAAAWRYSQTLSLGLAPVTGLISVAGPSILIGLAGPRWTGAGSPLAILVWAMAARTVFPVNALTVAAGRPVIDGYLATFSLVCMTVFELTIGWTSPQTAAWFTLTTDVAMVVLAMTIARWLWGSTAGGYRGVLGLWMMAGVSAAAAWAIPGSQGHWVTALIRGMTFIVAFGGMAWALPWSRARYRAEIAHSASLLRTHLLSL